MLTSSMATATAPTAARITMVTTLFMAWSSSVAVSAGGMTPQAGERVGPGMRLDRLDDRLMAVPAGRLGDGPVARGDLDGLRESAGRERERMPEAVERLRRVLGGEAGRRVAVVARGDLAMAGLGPAVVLLAHDVAVHARARIVGQVGGALRVHERVGADADADAEDDREDEQSPG